MIRLLFLALAASEVAAGLIGNPNNAPRALQDEVGGDYCTYSPNVTCYYPAGWPLCCSTQPGASCPEEQPPCDYCEVGPSADPSLSCAIEGKFCQLETGVCNNKAAIQPGLCAEKPQMCTMDMNPVCGCDGNTYSNACGAASAGVSVSYMGECNAETTSTATMAILGSSYCTYGPDEECYESGWPSCCADEATCPEEQPPCEIATTSSTMAIMGSSYCTYSPDEECYESGWPSCCADDNSTCPEEQPPCEITTTSSTMAIMGSSYCTYSPDMECYESGWPSCCADDNSTCPEEQPPCEITTTSSTPVLLGSSYCTYSPNTTCYESGWPSCCGVDNSTCPDEQPPCENATTPVTTMGEAASAASVLSSLSFVTAVVGVTVSIFMTYGL